jgi:hypothetical protein
MDPSRSAAVAMAGLAGHNVDELGMYHATPTRWSTGSGASTSPDMMANDLTSLFEAVGGLQALNGGGMNGTAAFHAPDADPQGLHQLAIGVDDVGLSDILRELF